MRQIFFAAAFGFLALLPQLVAAKGASHSYGSIPAKLYSCPGCNKSDHYVAPTTRRNGEHVQGHMQTDPNATKVDNFTHKGNVNPYTGKTGSRH